MEAGPALTIRTPALPEFVSDQLWDRSLLLTTIAVAIISALSVWLAWHASDLAERISPPVLAPVLAAAALSYLLRMLRFYYFLRKSGVALSLCDTLVVQCVGFALSVTPGHIGEVFKLHLIRERAGTPVARTAPLLVLDRLTEGGGFLVLAIAAAWMLPALQDHLPVPTLTLFGLVALLACAVSVRYWGNRAAFNASRVARSRLARRIVPHLQNLWRGVVTSFTPTQILGGLVLSALARFADGLVVLLATHVMGMSVQLPEAVFVLAVSGLAGGISLLPAGTGAVETTMVGLLVLLGASLSDALAVTLLARLATLWLWVALGLVFAFALRLPRFRARSKEDQAI